MLRNRKAILALSLVAVVAILIAAWPRLTPKEPYETEREAAVAGAQQWLHTEQLDDGSFSTDFGHPAGVTCDVMLAIVASGDDPGTWSTAQYNPTAIQYLAKVGDEYASDAASTAKLVVTLIAAGQNPSSFGGQDYLARLRSLSDGAGTYAPGTVGQAWAVLALAAAGETVPLAAVATLKSHQLESGAWTAGCGPENDTTCLAIQALISAGEPADSSSIRDALAFLEEQQNDGGGFPTIKPSDWGTDTNANSTASVIMALTAAGEDPLSARWAVGEASPIAALLALQTEGGKIEFQPGVGSPLMATAQAVLALSGKALPLEMRE